MATIKQLKEGDKFIYPLTSTKAIVDEEGKRVSIPTKTSQLENDAQYVTQEDVQDKISSETLTAIEPISEVDYNAKLADGTLSDTIMYVIL